MCSQFAAAIAKGFPYAHNAMVELLDEPVVSKLKAFGRKYGGPDDVDTFKQRRGPVQ